MDWLYRFFYFSWSDTNTRKNRYDVLKNFLRNQNLLNSQTKWFYANNKTKKQICLQIYYFAIINSFIYTEYNVYTNYPAIAGNFETFKNYFYAICFMALAVYQDHSVATFMPFVKKGAYTDSSYNYSAKAYFLTWCEFYHLWKWRVPVRKYTTVAVLSRL